MRVDCHRDLFWGLGYALSGNADTTGEVVACMMEQCKCGDLTGVGELLLTGTV